MITFMQIGGVTILVVFACLGVGRILAPKAVTSGCFIRGWSLILLFCSAAWYFRFPAVWLAPAFGLFLLVGLTSTIRRFRTSELVMLGLGALSIALLFSLPFLRFPTLQAYARSGTDQWGYATVARWLVLHPVTELPQVGEKMGLNWVWHVLNIRERPLIYLVLATISGTTGVTTILAYYILPSALVSSVFGCIALAEKPLGFSHPLSRFILGIIIALQPLLLIHLQLQFLAGTVVALMMMMVIIALLQAKTTDITFFAWVVLYATCLAGLYSIKAVLPLILVVVVNLFVQLGTQSGREGLYAVLHNKRKLFDSVTLLVTAIVLFSATYVLAPETLRSPYPSGRAGHVAAQLAAYFGQTSVLPWYFPDGSPDWMDPVAHHPAGTNLSLLLASAACACWLAIGWYEWRKHHKATALLLLFLFGIALISSAPPLGSHWTLSRSLPILGAGLFALFAAADSVHQRWFSYLVVALCLLIAFRATSFIAQLFWDPQNRFYAQSGVKPPDANIWNSLAFVYFYENERTMDWSESPHAFQSMTHYLPADIRPRLVDGIVQRAPQAVP